MELGPQHHNGDGLLGLNSIIIVYMDPLGSQSSAFRFHGGLGLYAVGLRAKVGLGFRSRGLVLV